MKGVVTAQQQRSLWRGESAALDWLGGKCFSKGMIFKITTVEEEVSRHEREIIFQARRTEGQKQKGIYEDTSKEPVTTMRSERQIDEAKSYEVSKELLSAIII